MKETKSIEALIQQGQLAEAQQRFQEYLLRCSEEITQLAQNQSQLSNWENKDRLGMGSDAFERNRIALSLIVQVQDFKSKVVSEYFDIQDKLSYFDSISNRDDVINTILDHRLMPKNYTREKQLLEGNSSIIYQLSNPVMRRHAIALVLKMPDLREAAQAQILQLTDLRHRNVIKVLDHDIESFPYFVITEYVYGVTLPKALAINGPRPVPQAVDWIYQLTEALDYLRHKRIFHTNVRPSKIYVDDEWQMMISPFDLGHFSNAEQTYNRFRDVWQYGSPEMIKCDGVGLSLNEMCISDQYSLGLLAYKILTGKDLFEGETVFQIMTTRQRFIEDKKYREARLAELPKSILKGHDQRKLDFVTIIRKLLAENPADRYRDLHDLLRALHPLTRADEQNVSNLRQSYRRCLAINKEFINDFYRAFTASKMERTGVGHFPEEKEAKEGETFANEFNMLSLKRQSTMLQMAIDLIIDIDKAGERLKGILHNPVHQKYGLPDFECFTQVLLGKIRDNDPQWNPELEKEWQEARTKTLALLPAASTGSGESIIH